MATVDLLLDKVKDMAPTLRSHAAEAEQGVCSGYVYMPCMAYARLSQVPRYAK